MNEIIPMGRVNQKLVLNIALVLEGGISEAHHSLIEAHLPFMSNRNHTQWCVGGIWGFVNVAIESLREIAKSPNCVKFNSAQLRMFKEFMVNVKKQRDLITLHIWFANDHNWQIKFTRADSGHYVPMNAWVDDYNVFDKIITDCAVNFKTTRADVLETWGGKTNG